MNLFMGKKKKKEKKNKKIKENVVSCVAYKTGPYPNNQIVHCKFIRKLLSLYVNLEMP